ncbi:MAG: hypothetical protein PHR61_03855 [Candidatus Absconditabacteria bacterium]|nr:hypothetical protein [Candidatus Absconditabacteria bacterium]
MDYKCKRDFFSKDNQYFEKRQVISEEEYQQLMFDDQEYFEVIEVSEKNSIV